MPAYDAMRRRLVGRTKTGGQKGVYVYIPAEEIRRAGIDPDQVTHYRVWGSGGKRSRGGIRLRLYRGE